MATVARCGRLATYRTHAHIDIFKSTLRPASADDSLEQESATLYMRLAVTSTQAAFQIRVLVASLANLSTSRSAFSKTAVDQGLPQHRCTHCIRVADHHACGNGARRAGRLSRDAPSKEAYACSDVKWCANSTVGCGVVVA